MISFDTFRAIEEMLKDGITPAQISSTTGVSVGTIENVRDGKHVWQKRLAAGYEIEGKSAKQETSSLRSRTPQRCPGCGRKVTLPCRICAAEEFKRREREQGRSYEPIDEVRLDCLEPPSRSGLAQPPDDQPSGEINGTRPVPNDWESRARAILGC